MRAPPWRSTETLQGLPEEEGGADETARLGPYGGGGGGSGVDGVQAGSGADSVNGGLGADTLSGGDGNDSLGDGPTNDAGVDTIGGGVGDDDITAANDPSSRDIIKCGDGYDTVLADTSDEINDDCEDYTRRLTPAEDALDGPPARVRSEHR